MRTKVVILFKKFLALSFLLFWSQQVLAHANIAGSVPSDGAIVAQAVSSIELRFSMPARLTMIEIEQPDSGTTTLIAKELPSAFAEDAIVPVETLGAGDYEVHWTAVARDGHVMKGEFSFRVED